MLCEVEVCSETMWEFGLRHQNGFFLSSLGIYISLTVVSKSLFAREVFPKTLMVSEKKAFSIITLLSCFSRGHDMKLESCQQRLRHGNTNVPEKVRFI